MEVEIGRVNAAYGSATRHVEAVAMQEKLRVTEAPAIWESHQRSLHCTIGELQGEPSVGEVDVLDAAWDKVSTVVRVDVVSGINVVLSVVDDI